MKTLFFLLLGFSLTASAQQVADCMSPRIGLFGFCLPPRHSLFDATVSNTTMLNPACPVTLTGIYMGKQEREGTPVSVRFVNASDKRMIAVKFGLTGFDATHDAHAFSESYALPVNLKPRKRADLIWRIEDEDFDINTAGGARVDLVKVVFVNGETWQDDGTRSCSLTIEGIAKPHHDVLRGSESNGHHPETANACEGTKAPYS
jgi:hypothetical protein